LKNLTAIADYGLQVSHGRRQRFVELARPVVLQRVVIPPIWDRGEVEVGSVGQQLSDYILAPLLVIETSLVLAI